MFRLLLLSIITFTQFAFADKINDSDRQQLLDKIEQFNSAIREGDKQKYSDVFTDDFIFTWSRNGRIYTREMILPNVVPTPDYQPIVDEILIRVHGDSAIVNYRVRRKEQDTGTRVTFSYSRIKGEWKVIATHSTQIVPSEPTTETEK